MAGITPFVTAALPLAGSVVNSVSGSSGATNRERELALASRLRQEEQERAWRREDERAEQARAREMEWLTRGQNQTASHLRASQGEALRGQEGEAGLRRAQLATTAEADERRRVDALRRAMGRTRAGLGGRGVSSVDGSGEAILLGLVGETVSERRDAQALDQIRLQTIQQELDDRRRLNLLEQAQLAERQRLEFMSRFY